MNFKCYKLMHLTIENGKSIPLSRGVGVCLVLFMRIKYSVWQSYIPSYHH